VRRALPTTLALLAGAAAPAAAPAALGAGAKPQKKTVKVLDNYFSPAKLTVNRRSTITFRWPDDAGDTHDAVLDKGPKGARRFASDPGAAGFSYKARLTVPGSYRIICTFHEEMVLTVRVRK
jgi:plastocyanin